MTYHRGDGISCDECPESFETSADFNEAKAEARAAGWRTFMGPDKKFADACPVCVAAWAEKQQGG